MRDIEEYKQNFSILLEEYKKAFAVLVVDDSPTNVDILVRRLKREGFEKIFTAENGISAIECTKKEKVDLILLDVMMPKMDGYEVLEHLRDEILARHLMVLMISAASEMDNIVKCIKLGAEDFLPKPFNTDLLRVRIGACLEKKWFSDRESLYLERIKEEKRRYEGLLNSIFPPTVVQELTRTNQVKPKLYTNVAVLFTDIVGFTTYCDSHSPEDVISNLQELTDMSETIVMKHNVQKIKTIGDAFMAMADTASGSSNPVLSCIQCGEEMIEASRNLPSKWEVRVGIHFGDVMGGIVGHRQYLFDVFGDVVNTASRIQNLAVPGSIYLSERAWISVSDFCLSEALGSFDVKGKGSMKIYRYKGKKESLS